MAIEIVGEPDGSERNAAEELAKRLGTALRPEDRVTIVAGAKCYGEKRTDVDLLVLGLMAQGFKLKNSLLPRDIAGYTTYLSSFALVIEVKDHSGGNIRFVAGNQVDVCYNGRWSNASKQVHEEAFSVRSFLQRHVSKAPWIHQALWLRNVSRRDLPGDLQIVLNADCTADDILRLLVQQQTDYLSRQKEGRRFLTLSACSRENEQEIRDALVYFTRKTEPGALDRRKLELICQKILKDQKYGEQLGKQLLLFRGRGGAGKTLRLLQIARTLHEEQGARVLFLTYNKALVADVRRLLFILDVSDKIDGRTIHIQSSESYFWALLKAWDLSPNTQPDGQYPADDYRKKKWEINELLRGVTPAEVAAEKPAVDHPEVFAWDFVLVDEGQDWPEDERDLLFAVFGPERLIVADGVDQYVRTQHRCDWTSSIGTAKRQIVTLRKSLRLKSNLCRFASMFASEAGINWDMESDDDVAGGHVQLVLGNYTREVHQEIMAAHEKAKNKPIDALFCLTGAPNAPSSGFSKALLSWGANVWDGTTKEGRGEFPREVTEHRVVKYESCRGLEGWTVVCLDLDHFFDRKLHEGLNAERDLLVSPEEAAFRFAARWCLIPFTRAIDTLVVQIDPRSRLAERLLPIARAYEDFITVVH